MLYLPWEKVAKVFFGRTCSQIKKEKKDEKEKKKENKNVKEFFLEKIFPFEML